MRSRMGSVSPWLGWALLSAVFAAMTAIFAKAGLSAGIESDMATLLRTGVILVVLALFVAATGKWSDPTLIAPQAWSFITLSALATGASWVCYFRALKLGEASKVAPIDKLSVVLVALFAVLFLGERPSLRDWSGIALIASGVLLLALKR
ncbi:EamA family transporter [Paramagnetospirillum magnetotacticum]|nr:EamA family transporter [Paramagnetospirillum magnetotacticum]